MKIVFLVVIKSAVLYNENSNFSLKGVIKAQS